jgi:hypothetical protein
VSRSNARTICRADRELATILVAPRYWPWDLAENHDGPNVLEHLGGTLTPLSVAEIDASCEHLNLDSTT